MCVQHPKKEGEGKRESKREGEREKREKRIKNERDTKSFYGISSEDISLRVIFYNTWSLRDEQLSSGAVNGSRVLR